MRKPVTCTRIAPLFALLRLFAGAGTAGAGTAGVGTARAFDLGIEVEVLAAAGRPAPGVPEEIRFQNFLISPTLNAAGKVVFKGRLEGPGLGFYDAAGIWQWQAGQGVSLVIRDGEPAPGVATGTIVTGAPAINAAGELAFKGSVVEPGVFSDWGIWAPDGAGGLNLVAREGLPAELGTGAVYAFFLGEPLLNAAGQVAFRARVDGPGITVDNDCGVWAPRRGQPLRLIARELAPVPSPEAPPRVREFSPYLTLALNALGEVAFQSSFVRPLQEPGEGLYGPSPAGNLALLLRGGDPVPGLPEGHVFRGFTSTHPLQLGDEGELLVRASFDGAPIPGQDQGMWIRDRAGAFTLVALEGAEAPGVAPATPFTSLVTGVMNGARQVAFRGGVNVTRAGLWQFDPQRGVRLLALEGEPAPGFAPDMRFENFSSPHQSESGDVVFAARVSGLSPDLNHSFLDALFFVPFSGVPIAVLAAGDELEVAAGDVRTVQLVRLVQGSSSGRRILNESGQIAVQVTFSDGSPGVVVVSVPVDRDTDGDGVADVIDVCPEVEDPGQEDLDGDRVGDACPDTAPGAPVDAAGCSQAQFCAAVSPRRGWKGLLDCRIVDWRGDEPFARDCVLEFGWRGRRPSLSCRAPGG